MPSNLLCGSRDGLSGMSVESFKLVVNSVADHRTDEDVVAWRCAANDNRLRTLHGRSGRAQRVTTQLLIPLLVHEPKNLHHSACRRRGLTDCNGIGLHANGGTDCRVQLSRDCVCVCVCVSKLSQSTIAKCLGELNSYPRRDRRIHTL